MYSSFWLLKIRIRHGRFQSPLFPLNSKSLFHHVLFALVVSEQIKAILDEDKDSCCGVSHTLNWEKYTHDRKVPHMSLLDVFMTFGWK